MNETNILDLSVLIFGIIFCLEIWIRLPLVKYIKDLSLITFKIIKILKSSRISDHWKELVLIKYAYVLFLKSSTCAAFMLIGLTPMLLIFWFILDTNKNLLELMSDFYFLFVSIIISFLYFICRVK